MIILSTPGAMIECGERRKRGLGTKLCWGGEGGG